MSYYPFCCVVLLVLTIKFAFICDRAAFFFFLVLFSGSICIFLWSFYSLCFFFISFTLLSWSTIHSGCNYLSLFYWPCWQGIIISGFVKRQRINQCTVIWYMFVHLWWTCPHLFCSCSRENNEPPEMYWVTMANWLGSSRHAPTNWMIQGWLRRQRMETSLQNMSTSDFEQYVLALYLLKTTAERRRNQTTPHFLLDTKSLLLSEWDEKYRFMATILFLHLPL